MSSSAQIVLASTSPRRRELLDQIGIRYRVHPADIDETQQVAESPEDYVLRMAWGKTAVVMEQTESVLPVLGADTIVVLDQSVLGKPVDCEHAVSMLSQLSARQHRVLTAVAIHHGEQVLQAVCESRVWFRAIDTEEMLHYWRTGEPCDKAGAYAIQGRGAVFVARMEGSFSGVVGLPLYETARLLATVGASAQRPI